jgi:hypothetical protein
MVIGQPTREMNLKTALILIAAAGIGLIANVANAEDARVGVGVGPVGAGVTVGQSPRDKRDRAVREREPRDSSVVVKKERREPRDKTIIHERD